MAEAEKPSISSGSIDHRGCLLSLCRGLQWKASHCTTVGFVDGPVLGGKRTGWDVGPPARSESPKAIGVKETWRGVNARWDMDAAEEVSRFKSIGREKNFTCLERVKGRVVNLLEGLELHTGVFSVSEQKEIVDFVYDLQRKGRNHQLGEHTYSEPRKWMRGKGRVTIQFGCCYNYAKDKFGNPPGILKKAVPDPLPDLFKAMVKRLVRWRVLPPAATPDSCIINIYEPGDCIPPHIDSHHFLRPFSTVSFLSECDILFGSRVEISGPGEFSGSSAISLPVGSVLVMNGNGSDVAKHCVPAVPTKRISITFRKMDESKWPVYYVPEPDLLNIQPLELTAEEAESCSRETKDESSRKRKMSDRLSDDWGHHRWRSISGHWQEKNARRRSSY